MINDKQTKEKIRAAKIRKIVKIWILFLCVALVLSIPLAFVIGKVLIRWYSSGTYYDYKPNKMVAFVEKRYNVDIPDSAREIKAAKTGMSWDGWEGFILRFTAKPSEVNKFLETGLGTNIDSLYYRGDDRNRPYTSSPEWWIKPIKIKKGKAGSIYVEDTFVKDGSSSIYVWIDTSDEENNVVYLRGIYRSELKESRW